MALGPVSFHAGRLAPLFTGYNRMDISDFYRDPRLGRFDDQQEGVVQLDDLMDPPTTDKPPSRMVRFFSGQVTVSASVLIPDNVATFLKMPPEYWILRLTTNAFSTKAVVVSRQGGDDIAVYLGGAMNGSGGVGDTGMGMERRLILPGYAQWVRLTVPVGNANTIFYMVAACTGYNPNEVF